MTTRRRGPLARSKFRLLIVAPVVVTTSALAVVCFATNASAQDAVHPLAVSPVTPAPAQPAPPPLAQYRAANVPWPLSISRARKAARAEAVRAWGARKPTVVRVHRVSYSKVSCRVTWRSTTGRRLIRTVKVKRTSTYGVQAYAA